MSSKTYTKEELIAIAKYSIYDYLAIRPLSYSAISSFNDPTWGSPEKWFEIYFGGKKQWSREMDFGSWVDKKIQVDLTFIPTHPRYAIMQHDFKVKYKKIHLTGKPDWIDFDEFFLADTKTGKGDAWTQKKADDAKQLTAYLAFTLLDKKIPPEKFTCRIHWLPTVQLADLSIRFRDKEVVPVTFETKRTTLQVLQFLGEVEKTVEAMQKYVREVR